MAKLFELIDAVNDAAFWNGVIPAKDQLRIVREIAAAQGKPGAYANTFALTSNEQKTGIQLFTGEATKSAAARHIAGEEACRALLLLNVPDAKVQHALETATNELLRALDRSFRDKEHRMGGNHGTFCCGRCTVSVWRHVIAGGLDRADERLAGGLKALRQQRSADGKWGVFPVWYTLSALVDIDSKQAADEIKYVAKTLERTARKQTAKDLYEERRIELARRCLLKI